MFQCRCKAFWLPFEVSSIAHGLDNDRHSLSGKIREPALYSTKLRLKSMEVKQLDQFCLFRTVPCEMIKMTHHNSYLR